MLFCVCVLFCVCRMVCVLFCGDWTQQIVTNRAPENTKEPGQPWRCLKMASDWLASWPASCPPSPGPNPRTGLPCPPSPAWRLLI